MAQALQAGQDVTALMNSAAAPKSGDDVTVLMNTAPAPDFRVEAEPPSKTFADQWSTADTPEKRKALIAQTPVGQQIHHLMDLYVEHGPHAVVEGLKDLWHGDFAKGTHKVITGSGVTALPLLAAPLAAAAVAAPVATATAVVAGAGGGIAGQKLAHAGAEALGATPDQADVAGDIGAFVGGAGATKLAFKASDALAEARAAWSQQRRTAQGARATAQLQQAIPPSKSTPYSPEDLHRALPYLDVQHTTEPVESVDTLRKAADSSIKAIEDRISGAISANKTATIDINPVASLRTALAGNPRADFVKNGIAAVVKDYPQLKGSLSLADADRIRRALNADLDAMSAKNGYQLATARESDADFAAKEAIGKLLRAQVYGSLERLGVADVAELRRDEGALIAVRNAAQRQIFSGEKAVSGTGPSMGRKIVATALRGAPMNPLPAMATDAIARTVAPASLTHDELIAQAMRTRLRTGTSSTMTPLGTIPPTGAGLQVQP